MCFCPKKEKNIQLRYQHRVVNIWISDIHKTSLDHVDRVEGYVLFRFCIRYYVITREGFRRSCFAWLHHDNTQHSQSNIHRPITLPSFVFTSIFLWIYRNHFLFIANPLFTSGREQREETCKSSWIFEKPCVVNHFNMEINFNVRWETLRWT